MESIGILHPGEMGVSIAASAQKNGNKVSWQDGADQTFLTIPMYDTIDNLEYGGSYNSDCFPIEKNTPGN